MTVTPAALTITASNQAKTYGQMASLVTTAFTETGLVTANGDTIGGVTLASTGAAAAANVAGSPYAITASNATGSGLSNYTIGYGNGALTVMPAALTITANNASKTYGQAASLGSTAFGETGLVNSDTITGVTLASTGAAAAANVAGSPYAITASNAQGTGLGNYTISYGNGALTVNPLAVTLSGTQIYNGTNAVAGSALSVTNLVGADSVTVAGSGTMAAKDVGSQALASLTGLTLNNANYTVIGGSGSVNVTPATLTYAANAASRAYGTATPALSGTVTGFVGPDTQATATSGTLAFGTTATTASTIGTYAIAGSGLAAANGDYVFVQAASNGGALTINPAALTITANNASKTYGQVANLGTTAFSETGLVTANGDTIGGVTLASTGAAAAANVAGNPYAITASNAQGTGLGNYTISYGNGALTVNPLAVTLSGTQIYNGTNAVAGAALSVTNLVGADRVTVAGSGTMAAKDVGSQALASLTGLTLNNANYTVIGGSGSVNVTPATLTYAANAASRAYGTATPALSGTVTGFVGPDTQATATSGTLAFGTTATTASTIGTYAIAGSGLAAANGDYVFVQAASNGGALTINPAALTITANNASKTYGQVANLGTTAFSETGLVTANGDTIGGVTLASTGAAATANVAGSPYAITASNATGSGLSNYTIGYGNGALTVMPAALTITASNQAKTYGAAVPTLTASYAGLVNGDTAASLTTAPMLMTKATATSPVNSYAITASGAVDPNYAISYVAGQLTVTPATLVPGTGTGTGTVAPPVGLAATGLGSTIDDALLQAFGRPGEALPFIASTLANLQYGEDGSFASQIVRDLGNPRFDEIIICFKDACTFVPAPARIPQKTSQLETNVR